MIVLPGTTELLVILIIVIILFGASRFASLGTAVGRTVREIQNIPHAAKEDAAAGEEEKRRDVLDLEQIEGLHRDLRMLLNPRNLLLKLLNWLLFRAR